MKTTNASTIYFAHANGFPALTYRKFFSYLEQDFVLDYIDQVAHNSHYPVNDNWQYLVAELIAHLESRHQAPVIGVGHSLGGALIYMACLKRPDLFRAIVLLDSPVILSAYKSKMLLLAKYFGFIDHLTPAHRTKNRRALFPDVATARAYFKGKLLFQHFDEECLDDYVREGLVAAEHGLRLKFSPRVEYQIYRTIPHHLSSAPRILNVPAGLIYGEASNVVTKREARNFQKHNRFLIASIAGGHLFPFEHPELTAKQLTAMIARLIS